MGGFCISICTNVDRNDQLVFIGFVGNNLANLDSLNAGGSW